MGKKNKGGGANNKGNNNAVNNKPAPQQTNSNMPERQNTQTQKAKGG